MRAMAQTQKKAAKPITTAQIKRIHVVIHSLRIDDDTYRAALTERFSVTTCKDLSLNQAQAFIRELEAVAIKHQHPEEQPAQAEKQPERFSNLDNRPGMASAAQLRKIEAQWSDVSIVPDHDARGRALRTFIKRISGVADLRFLDSQGASKVINALNAMQKQATAPAKTKKAKTAE